MSLRDQTDYKLGMFSPCPWGRDSTRESYPSCPYSGASLKFLKDGIWKFTDGEPHEGAGMVASRGGMAVVAFPYFALCILSPVSFVISFIKDQ